MILGNRLKLLRTKKGLSITVCAKALSVSPSTYRDWEYGRSMNGEPYQKLAELFEVSVSEILGLNRTDLLIEIEKAQEGLEQTLHNIKNIRSFL